MISMKKRIYEKPTMMVVMVKNQQHLLQGSATTLRIYSKPSQGSEDDYLTDEQW